MFYQEALPKFWVASRVDSLLTNGDRHWRKLAAIRLKSRISNFTSVYTLTGFMWGAYFCMGAYKRNVVVVIKIGAYIHGVLIFYGLVIADNRIMTFEPSVWISFLTWL